MHGCSKIFFFGFAGETSSVCLNCYTCTLFFVIKVNNNALFEGFESISESFIMDSRLKRAQQFSGLKSNFLTG